MKAAVLIPVYKSGMNYYECVSFTQVCRVLKNYPITLVCPEGLDLTEYYGICSKLLVETFDPEYFNGLAGYNQLMISDKFYYRFKKYNYILIYQLDAFVFRDELDYWCNTGLDYIGAPWFTGWHESTSESSVKGVGNGGFSLRNVNSILNQIKVLKRLQVIYKYDKYNWRELITKLPRLIIDVLRYNSLTPRYRLTHGQEDYFWCFDIKDIYDEYIKNESFVAKVFKIIPINSLKIPDVEIAIKFSMECQPARLFEMNNNKLPFGCHAWYKYDIEFWKPYIFSSGHELS